MYVEHPTSSFLGAGCSAIAAQPLPLSECLVPNPFFPRVRVATNSEDLIAIGRVRHQQYVERQGKAYRSIAEVRGCLLDECDVNAINLFTRDGAGVTAALRVADIASTVDFQREVYGHVTVRMGIPAFQTLTCTRLVRRLSHSGRHVVELVNFVRWQAVNAGWRYCLIQTSPELVPEFERIGFVSSGQSFDDAVIGRLEILLFDTWNAPSVTN